MSRDPLETKILLRHERHPNPHPQYLLAEDYERDNEDGSDLATTTPEAETVSETGAVGTSDMAARGDHRHAMPGLATASQDGFASKELFQAVMLGAADVAAHIAATDPHGDRAYADAQDVVAVSTAEAYSDTAVAAAIAAHESDDAAAHVAEGVSYSSPGAPGIANVKEALDEIFEPSSIDIVFDDPSETLTYAGSAEVGSPTSSAVWRIVRITRSGSSLTVEYADGSPAYVNIWDDHPSLVYA